MARIVQIIPAGGWRIEWHGDADIFTEEIVCWALLKDGNVVPMVGDDECPEGVEICQLHNYSLIPPKPDTTRAFGKGKETAIK